MTANRVTTNRELFETRPVPSALFSLAVPTVISQLIVMVYNLADTFFIGRTGSAAMVAAASLSYVLFFLLNAPANLCGIGGGSLMSRLLGEGRAEHARNACAISFYLCLGVTAVYAAAVAALCEPLLRLIGAGEDSLGYARDYTLWMVILGGVPASLAMTVSHLLRADGHGREAGLMLGLGSVLNIALDPLLMFVVLPKGMEITGAALATCLSNVVSLLAGLAVLAKKRGGALSLSPRRLRAGLTHLREILSVGFPSAVSAVLVCVAIMVTNALAAESGDVPVAAIGIVKKLEMLPHNAGTGLCQGMIPLAAYNFASGDRQRMRQAVRLTRRAGLVFTLVCVLLFEALAEPIAALFISDAETVRMTADFLRVMCLATPLTVLCFHATYTLQALGQGREAMLLACLRQGAVLIPLLLLLHACFSLNGLLWAQLAADAVTCLFALPMERRAMQKAPVRAA